MEHSNDTLREAITMCYDNDTKHIDDNEKINDTKYIDDNEKINDTKHIVDNGNINDIVFTPLKI